MKRIVAVSLSAVLLLVGCSCMNDNNTAASRGESLKAVVADLTADLQSDEEKIARIYNFVRDEIEFGWVYPQEIPAEEVLKKGKGVCMQKANLLVTMAREAGLRARFHFMYVHKNALEDFLPGYAYKRWVDPFPHTFPEVYLNGKWVSMEATIDKELHDICIAKKINFGKYENIVSDVSIEFSTDGVKGHQQYWHAEGKESLYGDDLSSFTALIHQDVPWYKRLMQPLIFRKADSMMNDLRIGSNRDA